LEHVHIMSNDTKVNNALPNDIEMILHANYAGVNDFQSYRTYTYHMKHFVSNRIILNNPKEDDIYLHN